jgi:hypothetical protein
MDVGLNGLIIEALVSRSIPGDLDTQKMRVCGLHMQLLSLRMLSQSDSLTRE